jgi:altronate hydrolase
MPDIIDYDCGPIIEGTPLADIADGLFEKIIATASGTCAPKRMRSNSMILCFMELW